MTIRIKRYPNRKLYNTVRKEYITLDGVADLIQQGEDVQVVDHASGEDLTALTLGQIVYDLEKRQAGSFPKPLLAGLVQSGGETLEIVRRVLAAPLDLGQHVDEEIEHRIDRLIAENELTYEEGQNLLDKLLAAGRRQQEVPSILEKHIEKVLEERGIPTRRDLVALQKQIDALARAIDEFGGQ